MSEELKPCPFCGTGQMAWENEGKWQAGCINEKCPVGRVFTKKYDTEAEAITAWNTRPSPWISVTPETVPFIPVNKRLILLSAPDEDEYCESNMGQWIRSKREFWYTSTESGILTTSEVTHYMPIPQE